MKIVPDKDTYFELLKGFHTVPFSQTAGWHDHIDCVKPGSILLLVDSIENPTMACMAHRKSFFNKKMLLVEGVCFRYKETTSRAIKEFFSDLTQLGYDMVELNIAQPYGVEGEIGLRQSGFLRPVGMFSSNLSLWVTLQTDKIDYNQNWKRNLKLAHSLNLEFEPVEQAGDGDIDLFLSMYQYLQKDKGFSFQLSKKELKSLLSSGHFQLAFVRNPQKEVLSGILYHTSGVHAGLLHAAKCESAKETGATFYMYEQLFAYLKEKGVVSFDMEKLVPATHSKNNVFLFKNGVKGEYVTYLGEWAWYKKNYYRMVMYFVKKYLMKKMEV